jgi:TPR repeat protein
MNTSAHSLSSDSDLIYAPSARNRQNRSRYKQAQQDQQQQYVEREPERDKQNSNHVNERNIEELFIKRHREETNDEANKQPNELTNEQANDQANEQANDEFDRMLVQAQTKESTAISTPAVFDSKYLVNPEGTIAELIAQFEQSPALNHRVTLAALKLKSNDVEGSMKIIDEIREVPRNLELIPQAGKYGDFLSDVAHCYEEAIAVKKDLNQAFKFHKLAANLGNRNSQFSVGWFFEHGIAVAENPRLAFYHYKAAANLGNSNAQYKLGYAYEHGLGVKRNFEFALPFYHRAVKRNHTLAQFRLGFLFENGIGVMRDLEQACSYYQSAAAKGHPLAQYHYAWILENHLDNGFLSFKYYKSSADQSYSLAQTKVAMIYERGSYGIEKNLNEAVRYYRAAAMHGHPFAQRKLENMVNIESEQSNGNSNDNLSIDHLYKDGIRLLDNGLVKDAIRSFRLAANLGDVKSMMRVADLHTNAEISLKFRKLAADHGDLDSVFAVGSILENSDKPSSFRYFKLAADRGMPNAQFKIGTFYQYGISVGTDLEQAFQYYNLAAEQGHVGAMFKTGWCYESGAGVQKNLFSAFKYYKLASDRNHFGAQLRLLDRFVDVSPPKRVAPYRIPIAVTSTLLGLCSFVYFF